ncbi:MAG: hypothetical protein L2C94_002115 [Aigarchaeota archaeon]|nr:hypothetical protein [Candidatus Wolframiiraptor gerlachensis]
MFMHPPISLVMQTALTALMEGASNASVVVVLTWLIVRVSVKIPVSMIVEVNVSWTVIMRGWVSDR